MNSDPDPELTQDTVLWSRLWFRFWGGWRKVMLSLVLLVGVAWGTRPDSVAHLRPAWLGEDSWVWPEGVRFKGVRAVPWRFSDYWVFTTQVQIVRNDERSGRSSAWPVRTIGVFGYVWVLDDRGGSAR